MNNQIFYYLEIKMLEGVKQMMKGMLYLKKPFKIT